jgi:hypothetical protein
VLQRNNGAQIKEGMTTPNQKERIFVIVEIAANK